MRTVFALPDLGEGLTESEVVTWNVGAGQEVKLNQILGEVETAKAVVELPSPFAGTVAELHAQPGDVVQVGRPLVTFEIEGEESAPGPEGGSARSDAADGQGAASSASAGGRTPTLVGYGAAVDSGAPARRRRSRHAAPAHAAAAASPSVPVSAPSAPAPQAGAPSTTTRPRATPPVRKLARESGLDLSTLEGTGPQGRITRDDVLRAAGDAAQATHDTQGDHPASGTGAPDRRAPGGQTTAGQGPVRTLGGRPRTESVPVRGVRKATAQAMLASVREQPQVSEFLTVDVTESMDLLRELAADREFRGVKVTPLALVAKAVLIALEAEPVLNARWGGDHIVMQSFVNLGIAAATDRGLVVPVIRDAQAMDLRGLAEAISDLAATARAGKTSPADLSGGTFTLSNVGVFGVDAGTPILNPGQSGIMAIGQVRRTPWEHRGEIALREVMTLSITFDHRLVDGAEGSRFLAAVGQILSSPGRTITMV